MKLMRHTLTKVEGDENHFSISEEFFADDPNELKSKSNELCELLGFKSSAWVSRYPIMGNTSIESNIEWVMTLENGTVFSIEK